VRLGGTRVRTLRAGLGLREAPARGCEVEPLAGQPVRRLRVAELGDSPLQLETPVPDGGLPQPRPLDGLHRLARGALEAILHVKELPTIRFAGATVVRDLAAGNDDKDATS
jgi:hypothetical protein